MITVKRKVNVRIGPVRKPKSDQPPDRPKKGRGKVPRVSRLMAIAIQFDKMLRSGEASDTLHLAELHSISQPRVTQIMNMALLAPDIQESLLNLPREFEGRSPINERRIRPLTAQWEWKVQRAMWKQLLESTPKK
jgi:hypothetical protein